MTTTVTSAVEPTKMWESLLIGMNVQDILKTTFGSKNFQFRTNGRSRLTDIETIKCNFIHENGWWTKRKATDQFFISKTNVVIMSDRQQLPNDKLHTHDQIYNNETNYGWRQQTQIPSHPKGLLHPWGKDTMCTALVQSHILPDCLEPLLSFKPPII